MIGKTIDKIIAIFFKKSLVKVTDMPKLQGSASFFQEGPPAPPGDVHPGIVRFLQNNIAGSSVLDLGGGQGAYGFEIQNMGYEVVVADINAESLKIADDNGLKTTLLEAGEHPKPKSTDTVVLIEVLEHVVDPQDFLKMAIQTARKKVLLTVPCSEDFERLFELGLSYGHIAVTDHLNHFKQKELENFIQPLAKKFTIQLQDPLFPHGAMSILSHSFSNPWIGKLCMLPLRIANRLGGIKKDYYSRFLCSIDVMEN